MKQNNNVLDSNTQRTKGIDALNSNIEAAKAVAQIVKTTLGPMGMDKMLIDNLGESIITNDGVKILKEMEIDHPGAKMLVDVAKTQESEVGDGTTSAVILSGELLSKAQELIKQKIHPTTIIRAYKESSTKALEILKNASKKINIEDTKVLQDICETAMTGKVADSSKQELSKIIIKGVNLVKDKFGVPRNTIKIQKIVGGDTNSSSIVEGVVLDKELAHPNMPRKINNAKILLADFALEVRELDSDTNLQVNSPQEYEAFLVHEQEYLKNLVLKIKEIGANVVVCQKGIDDNVAFWLAKEKIIAIRRTRKSDIKKLSKALNCGILNSFDDLDDSSIGFAGRVDVRDILSETYIFVEQIKNPKAITLMLQSATKHILDEIERAVEDAIGDLGAIIRSQRVVAGGGAIEVEIYRHLSEFSKTFEGKQQLVIQAFAESFLSIPKTLCENSGLDEIDTIAKLIANHEKKLIYSGLNSFLGVCDNTFEARIVEPINVKVQAIKSATEISSMILRIDDIIAARKLTNNNSSSRDTEF